MAINASNNPYPDTPDADPEKLDKGGYVGTAQTLSEEIDTVLNQAQLLITNIQTDSTIINGVTTSSSVPPTGNIHAIGIGPGTYPNWGGMVIPANNIGTLSRVDGVYSVSLTSIVIPTSKMTPWTATSYLSGDQVNHLGKDWVSNTATVAGDVPGTSSKWVERLSYAHLVVGKNLFDGSYIDGYFLSSGELDATSGFKVSNFIAVEETTDYFLSGRNAEGYGDYHTRIVFYDSTKTKLAGTFSGGYITPNGGVYCPSPVGAKFIRFGIDHPATNNLPNIQLELGTSATAYESYEKKILHSELPNNIATTDNIYEKQYVDEFFAPIVRKNLFNKDTISEGYVIGESGLVSGPNASWHVSDFIPVEPNSTYFLSGRINTNSDAGGISLFDASKTVIPFNSAMFPDSVTTNFWVNENGRVVTPANCAYVRFTVDRLKPENKDTIQFEKGSVGTSYWDFDKLLVPYEYLPITEPVVETLVKWEAIGDSMTYLNNALADTQGRVTKGYMTQTIEKIPRLSVTNRGYNGYQTSSIAGTIGTWQLADIYSILLTTNDWGFGSRTIGTISDYINNTGSGTVFGAYRIMTDRIYFLNPTALIILITPPQRGDFVYIADKTNNALGSYTTIAGKTLSQFADAIIEIAKYMSIPLVDLYYNSGFNQRSVVKYKRLKHPTTGVYTNYVYPDFIGVPFNASTDDYPYPLDAIGMTYDGLHPSDKGNEVIAQMICDEIKKHLKI